MEQTIMDHWNNIDYEKKQKELRELYENILSPAGFITTLATRSL